MKLVLLLLLLLIIKNYIKRSELITCELQRNYKAWTNKEAKKIIQISNIGSVFLYLFFILMT